MKKVRLSKTKANKFNESGQLVAFYALSVAWAINIFKEVNFKMEFLPLIFGVFLNRHWHARINVNVLFLNPTKVGRTLSITILSITEKFNFFFENVNLRAS